MSEFRYTIEILKVDGSTVAWNVSSYTMMPSGVLQMTIPETGRMYVSPNTMWSVLVVNNYKEPSDKPEINHGPQ